MGRPQQCSCVCAPGDLPPAVMLNRAIVGADREYYTLDYDRTSWETGCTPFTGFRWLKYWARDCNGYAWGAGSMPNCYADVRTNAWTDYTTRAGTAANWGEDSSARYFGHQPVMRLCGTNNYGGEEEAGRTGLSQWPIYHDYSAPYINDCSSASLQCKASCTCTDEYNRIPKFTDDGFSGTQGLYAHVGKWNGGCNNCGDLYKTSSGQFSYSKIYFMRCSAVSKVFFLAWPITVGNDMATEYGITDCRWKVQFPYGRDTYLKTWATGFGRQFTEWAYLNSSNCFAFGVSGHGAPACTCSEGTYTLDSLSVTYGTAPDLEDALQQVIDETDNVAGTIAPFFYWKTTKTYTSPFTLTAGVGDAWFFIGIRPSTTIYAANPIPTYPGPDDTNWIKEDAAGFYNYEMGSSVTALQIESFEVWKDAAWNTIYTGNLPFIVP